MLGRAGGGINHEERKHAHWWLAPLHHLPLGCTKTHPDEGLWVGPLAKAVSLIVHIGYPPAFGNRKKLKAAVPMFMFYRCRDARLHPQVHGVQPSWSAGAGPGVPAGHCKPGFDSGSLMGQPVPVALQGARHV